MRVGLSEAARLLQELGICKAFREGNKINGPNCYRFAEKDPVVNRWSWDIGKLLHIAKMRNSAPPSLIEEIAQKYGIGSEGDEIQKKIVQKPLLRPSQTSPKMTRAELEKIFRDKVLDFESKLRKIIPMRAGFSDQRTLGKLINEIDELNLLQKHVISEARFVNTIRNSLSHSNLGEVSDDQLKRGTESVNALIRIIENLKGERK